MFELNEPHTPEQLAGGHYFLVFVLGILYFALYALHLSGLTTIIPLWLRLPLAGVVFCVAPGLALYSFISLGRPSHFSYLTLLILSCSLGFTCNFLANVFLYARHGNVATATTVYLHTVAAAYLFLFAFWARRGICYTRAPKDIGVTPLLIVGGVFLLFIIALANKQSAGYYIEELIVLRKLAENPVITVSNLAFRSEEYTTYLFVPFYLFVTLCAHFAQVDVINAIAGLWPFTAAISTLCLAGTSRILFRRDGAVIAIVVLAIIQAAWVDMPTSNIFTVFAPFPDRYAVASSILIPLALFHFLIHMGERKINLPAFIGLIYLITEITFIHARETLFLLAIIVVSAGIMAFRARANIIDLKRICWLLGIIAGILIIYRQIVVATQPDLGEYLGHLRGKMRATLDSGLHQHGVLSLFGIPQRPFLGTDEFAYAERFGFAQKIWAFGYLSLAMALLPAYILLVRRPAALLLPAAIAVFGLFSLFQGLRLGIGILVGAPYIFDIFSILFLLVTLVFADGVGLLAAVVAGTVLAGLRSQGFRLIAVTTTFVLMLLAVLPSGYATNSPYLEMLIYLSTLIIVVVRYRSALPRRLQFSNLRHIRRLQAFTARLELLGPPSTQALAALVLALAFGSILAVDAGQFFKQTPIRIPTAPTSFSIAAPVAAFDAIATQRNFAMTRNHSFYLPPNLAEHVRNHLPPMQTWFGGHTLPIVALSNQYAITLTVANLMTSGFILNNKFLAEYFGSDTGEYLHKVGNLNWGDLSFYLGSQAEMEKLATFLQANKVRYIITRPDEEKYLDGVAARWPRFARHFVQEYRDEGFRIYRLTAMSAAKDLQ
jgi:hypothetical protein